MTNTEGGTDDEEFRVAAIKDRVDTTMQVWMGLTMGCAKCHSHKFDPITQEEYYKFYAIFNQTADNDQPDESAGDSRADARRFWSASEDRRRDRSAAQTLEASTAALAAAQAKWESSLGPAGCRAKGTAKEILTILDTSPATNQASGRSAGAALPLDRAGAEAGPRQDRRPREVEAGDPDVPVMVELPADQRRVTHLLRKGNFLDPGDVVEPGVPRSLPSVARRARPRTGSGWRSGWSIRENPLTARVAVNRYWAQIFGIGLVETEEDFGTQGEPPSHPELLDWLAVRYRESGWNTKALLRLIVTSATYRQSSKVTARAAREGPAQPPARAGASGPTRGRDGPRPGPGAERTLEPQGRRAERLPAPAGRASGRPPSTASAPGRPARATTATAAGSTRSGAEPFRIRRWPSFDAPSREICAIRRVRTNTPAPVARDLERPGLRRGRPGPGAADRPRGGHDVASRARFGLQLCLCRPPRPEQVEPLVALYASGIRALPQGPGGRPVAGDRPARAASAGHGAGRPGRLDHGRQRPLESRLAS